MSLLTEQECYDILGLIPDDDRNPYQTYARAIESAVLASPVLNQVKAEANVEPPIPVAPGKEDASFEHWYETKFKPAMERGPFDRYVARQAWFASKAYAIEKGEGNAG